jgi:predicted metalloprotease
MKWQGRRKSDNLEDRRMSSGKTIVGGGLIGIVILL